MSDQSLREALEQICDDYSAIDVEMLRETLAAHPAEPAPVVTGEAVVAADRAFWEHPASHGQNTAARHRAIRASLEAAAPLLGPRPLLDREEARVVAREAITAEVNSWPDDAGLPYFPADLHPATTMQRLANPAVDAVMGLARPMPTREQIGSAVHDAIHRFGSEQCLLPRAGETSNCYQRTMRTADAALAVVNGAES